MANESLSLCPPPFLDAAHYPFTGGQNASRLCAQVGAASTCCLPCPLTNWVYADNFSTVSLAAEWVALASVVCCVFMLISFMVLPVQRTSRHYLTACLVTAVGLLTLSFVIPLGAQPPQCYDAITPNDMQSNLACAFSGALVLFGGMASVMWVFIRSLFLHLQICWQITPGKKFFTSALLGGWGVPVLILGLSLSLSGVSYRFGEICHINHDNSLATFWGPLLGFVGVTAVLQFATLGYCIRVYLRSLADPGATSATTSAAPSSALPSFAGSIRTVSARAAYRRVRKVIALQWRAITVVLILIISTTYFAVIFLKLDNATVESIANPDAIFPWVLCLLGNAGNKDACLGDLSGIVVGEPAVAAVLYLIASMGFWCVLFLGRWSMIYGWWDLIKRPFTAASDRWVSADARRASDPRNYEMLTAPPKHFYMTKGPQGLVAAKAAEAGAPIDDPPISPSSGLDKELDGPIARDFSPSANSFYAPPTPLDPALMVANSRQESVNFSRPQRSGSQSTARVTFSRDGTTVPAAPSSPLSSPTEFHTPRAFANQEGHPGQASSIYSEDRDYFGGGRSGSRSGRGSAAGTGTGTETGRGTGAGAGAGIAGWRSGAASGNGSAAATPRSGSALGRQWHGHSAAQLERSSSALSGRTSRGSVREWDHRSTFAHGSAQAGTTSAARGRQGALSPGV